MKKLAVALGLFVSLLTPLVPAQQTYTVGFATRSFTDDARRNYANTGPRPLDTVIWYPAAAGSNAVVPPSDDFVRETFVVDPVATDAALPLAPRKFPLIVLSHGNSSLAYSLGWFAWFLASRGYIVAAVNHHGNTAAEPKLLAQGFMLEWERPRDLSALIDKMLADPTFGQRIDSARIGAAGHSAGGATVIETAGGVPDTVAFCTAHPKDINCDIPPIFQQWIAEYNKIKDSDPVIQASLTRQHATRRDRRVKAVFAMAPALGFAFPDESLRSIHIPVFITAGAGDVVVDPATNAGRYAKLISSAQYKLFPGKANHYIYGTLCKPAAEKALDTCYPDAGVDRAKVHEEVGNLALEFFNKNLR